MLAPTESRNILGKTALLVFVFPAQSKEPDLEIALSTYLRNQ